MVEAITKYTILGSKYVKLNDLNELIKDMQRKTREGTEPGYMIEDEHQRIAANLALNHLRVVLNAETNFDTMLYRIMKTRFEREAKEEAVKKTREAIDAAFKAVDRAEKMLEDISASPEEKPVKRAAMRPSGEGAGGAENG